MGTPDFKKLLGSLQCKCRECVYACNTEGLKKPEKCLSDESCRKKQCSDCHCYPIDCKYFTTIPDLCKKLKDFIEETSKLTTFHFSNGKTFDLLDQYKLKEIERFPTSIEVKRFLLNEVRWEMLGKELNTCQYRSMKGEIYRDHWKGPVYFLRKSKTGQEILSNTLGYLMSKKTELVGKVNVTFPEKVKTKIIEINIEKKEGE